MFPAIHHEMQCFLVTTRERCVVTTRGSCDRYLVRVKGGVHLGNQFAGSYEVEPTCWHLFVFIGTTVRSSDIRNNRLCGVAATALRNLEGKRDSGLFGVLLASDAIAARVRGIS